jgi:hypothetical protein
MHRASAAFATAMVGIVIGYLSSSAGAQSQSSLGSRCPAGYWLLEPVCINQDTGDVVNAAPAAASRVAFAPGCRPGYWRLDSLCFSSATGDVELVDENTSPADHRAELRH